jgi:hypothetical protein
MGVKVEVGGGGISQSDADTRYVNATGNETVAGTKTFSSPVLVADGTAAAPSLAFSSDADGSGTGIFRGAANGLSVSTNGVERWMFNSSGNINPIVDNTYDIGSSLVRPRDVYVGRNLAVGGTSTFTGAAVAPPWGGQYVLGNSTSVAASNAGYNGTLTQTGTGSSVASASGALINYASVATTGNFAGWAGALATHGIRAEYLPDLRVVLQDVAESNYRMFVGISDSASLNADSVTQYFAGFRHHTTAGDTHWTVWHSNNAAGNTTFSTGVAVSANVVTLRIKWTSISTIEFYIDGTLVHTASTNTPQPTAATMFPIVRKLTTENVAKNIRIRSVRVDLPGLSW